jgi:Cdc6-like AAA superfamily ATPase
MLSLAIALQGILLLLAAGRLDAQQEKFGNYIYRHRINFAGATALGTASIIFFPWLQNTAYIRSILLSQNARTFSAAFLILVALLIVSWPALRDFWTRSRRTWVLEAPPLQNLHLAFVFLASVALVIPWHDLPATSFQFRTTTALSLIAIVSWIVSAWLLSQRPTVPASFSPDLHILSDEPICLDTDDRLHRTTFIDSLYRQITSVPLSDSFVIALNGPWGSGKTSILRLLANRIGKNPNLVLIEFNPWLFGSEAALIEGFYSAIERALVQEYEISDFRRQLTRYSKLLSFGLGSDRFGFRLQMPSDPESLRQNLEAFLEQTKRQFVIIVDDIDRLHHRELLALFKLVRFSSRFQRTVFLLSFDNIVVAKALQTETVDPEFIDKIVQMQIDLPPAEQNDIDNFVLYSKSDSPEARSAIDRVLDALKLDPARRKQFNDEFVPFYLTTLYKVMRTIRKAKRFINAVSATLPALIGEVHEFDFCLLTSIRLFYPQLYRDIWENRFFYVPPAEVATARAIAEHVKRQDYAKAAKDRTLDLVKSVTTDPVEAESVLEILKRLFGEIKRAIDGPLSGGRAADRDRQQKRINAPECFERYFLLRALAGEISDREVESLIAKWNTFEAADVGANVYADLSDFKARNQLSQLLRRLFVFWHNLKPALLRAVAVALAKGINLYSRDPGEEGWQSENNLALLLILQLINGEQPESEIQPTILEILSLIDDDHLTFGVQLVDSCSRNEALEQIRKLANVPELHKHLRARLRKYYIEDHGNLFALSDDNLVYVAYQWGIHSDLTGAKQEVADLLFKQFKREPQLIGRYLQAFFKREEFVWQRFGSFALLIEPAEMLKLLDQFGQKATTGIDQGIVEAFRAALTPQK